MTLMTLPFPNIHSQYSSNNKILPLYLFPSPIVKTLFRRPPRSVRMDSAERQKDKIVVVMGATGCGKTKLSIDLGTKFQSEIINSDKMQVYNGLDITTNKIPIHERLGVPHHLFGVFDPDDGEVSSSEFRLTAGLAISEIVSRQKLPLVVGGSNSFIHALVVDRFNPEIDIFCDGLLKSNPVAVSTQLRYRCCFLWVDVSLPVLCDHLCKRVDEMLELGMFDELSEYYISEKSAIQPGLRKAIGIPEFDQYFNKYPPGTGRGEWDEVRKEACEAAVRMIKENTCQLAKRQIGKIMRLNGEGWDLQRIDATEAFRVAMEAAQPLDNGRKSKKKKKKKKKKRWMEVWKRDVVEPSMKIVNRFLEEE